MSQWLVLFLVWSLMCSTMVLWIIGVGSFVQVSFALVTSEQIAEAFHEAPTLLTETMPIDLEWLEWLR